MDAGSVRGTFDLNTPAKRKLDELKRAGAETDKVFGQLGHTLDTIGGPEFQRRADSIRSAFGDMAGSARDAAGEVKTAMGMMRQSVSDETRLARGDIRELRQDLRALGRETAKPSIDLGGVARANAEVAALRRNLSGLSRERATPRVAMGGGMGGLVRGMGAGGGGGGSAVSQRGGGLVDFGLKGIKPMNVLIGAGLGFARPLIGGATSLVGSAGGAALGAGAVGLSGLGVGAAGLAGIAAIAKPAVTGLKNVAKAQQLYNKAVQEYGRRSKEAATARRNLNFVERQNPGAASAMRGVTGFTRDWQRMTTPGRRQFYGLIGDVARAGRRAAPNMAYDANLSMGAARHSGGAFANFLAGPQTQQTLTTLTHEFVRDLPFIENGLQNVALTLEHISVAALPFFHEAVVWGDKWTKTWASSTSNIYGTRREIGHFVQEFKDWRDLTGTTLGLLRDIFQMSAPSGDSMVVSLTHTLDAWDQWIRLNPDKVHHFFTQSEKEVSSLAGALVQVVGALNQMMKLVEPLLFRFTQLANIMGGAGLLLPTAGRIALGSIFGGKGGRGAGGVSPAAAGIAGAYPMMGSRGGGGVVTGRPVNRGRFGMRTTGRTGYLAPRYSSTAPTTGAGAMYGASTMLLGSGRRTVRISDPAAPGGLAAPETFAERYGGIEGAHYAAPVSTAGESVSTLGRGAEAARGLGAGALRFAAPLFALQGLLGAATTQGNAAERFQGGLSAASFNLIPMPVTAGQARAAGGQQAAQRIGTLGPARTSRGVAAQMANLRTLIAQNRGIHESHTGLFGGHGFLGAFDAGRGNDQGVSSQAFNKAQGRIKVYTSALKDLNRQYAELRRNERATHVGREQQRARGISGSLGGVFQTYNRKDSVSGAFDSTVKQMMGSFHGLGKAGSEVLAQNMLSWAREMERHNPDLKGKADDLAKSIEQRFDQMGKHIRVVNGQIYDGSRTQWKSIAQSMSDPIELAKERMSSAFTAVQNQALNALVAMGFSNRDARGIVTGIEKGGSSAALARNDASVGAIPTGNGGTTTYSQNVHNQAKSLGRQRGGGVIPGSGMMDTVALPGGAGYAAPGEYWIANRHTMSDLSRATVAMYGKTASQMITGETRKHAYHATGDPNVRPGTTTQGGRAAGLQPGMASIVARLATLGFTPTSTTGGTHAAHSLHYLGEAADFGNSINDLPKLWNVVRPQARKFAELFGPSSLRPGPTLMHYGQGFNDAALQAEHQDHIHVGFTGRSGGARGLTGSGGGAYARQKIRLRAPVSGLGGVPGALADRGSALFAGGLQSKINSLLGSMGGGSIPGGGGAPTANMKLGKKMMLARGWGGGEWPALRALWTRESGWNSNAVNPSSGAYGIPQSLGHGRPYAMGDAGAQIAWGLNYIRNRYGSPSGAWGHEQSAGWYQRGGNVRWGGWHRRGLSAVTNGPTLFGAGEGGKRERVTIGPAHGSSGGHRITVDMRGTVIHNAGDIDTIGERVAQKILDAIDNLDNAEAAA